MGVSTRITKITVIVFALGSYFFEQKGENTLERGFPLNLLTTDSY